MVFKECSGHRLGRILVRERRVNVFRSNCRAFPVALVVLDKIIVTFEFVNDVYSL